MMIIARTVAPTHVERDRYVAEANRSPKKNRAPYSVPDSIVQRDQTLIAFATKRSLITAS
jgi:hypothetical protein